MMKFKTSLLVATTVAAIAASGAAYAGTGSVSPFPLSTAVTDGTETTGSTTSGIAAQTGVLTDGKIGTVAQSPAAALSLANNPFAIDAPGNPETIGLISGSAPTASGTDYYGVPVYTAGSGYVIYDGDHAVHGAGSTAVQNVLVRAMNCFGTPSPRGTAEPGAATVQASTAGGLKTLAAANYNGSPALICDNGTWVTQASTAAAPTGGVLYGYANHAQTQSLYYVPGTVTASAELQPQFSDYSLTTGNLAPYGFAGKYNGTGSGTGQKAWYFGTDVFDDGNPATNQNKIVGVPNPFVSIAGQNYWSHVQFAATDAPLSAANIASYNANVLTIGGAPIEFPLFVTPVAIVYNTVYAQNTANNKYYTFNAKGSATYPTGKVATLQLSGAVYCGIFNGMITNWNDAALTQANKNTPLYDLANDNLTRWNGSGAPIRLVGRMDNSGTTDIFTRHLAQVCKNPYVYGSSTTSNYFSQGLTYPLLPYSIKKNFVPNKYLQHAQTLPFDGTVDFTAIRADSHIATGSYSSSNDAGSVNVISEEYFDGTDIKTVGTRALSLPNGYNGSGYFIVANGGSAVATAINLAPDYDPVGKVQSVGTKNGPTATGNLLFNGKIGYVSADVQTGLDAVGNPSTGYLRAATLASLPNAIATSATGGIYPYTYVAPTLKNALSAFNTTGGTLAFLPPESDASGNFVGATTNVTSASGGYQVRSNPLAWTDAFYGNASGTYSAVGNASYPYTLAQPSQGYPIVGTTQLMTYTCFYSAGNREAIATLVATLTGQFTVDSTNAKINKAAFSSSSAATPGIIGDSSLGIVPGAWQTAIANTFLKGTSDVNTSTSGGGSTTVGTVTGSFGYSASPLNFTSAIVPTKVKLSAGAFIYTPTLPAQTCLEPGSQGGATGTGTLKGM